MGKARLRPIRIKGNVAFITLTQGHVAIVDVSDLGIVEKYHWSARVSRNTVYGQRADWSTGKAKLIRLHRDIMKAPVGVQVDHISGDGLDNRRANLRLATNAENTRNMRLGSDNTSGFKGVSFRKDTQRWRAYIVLDGVHHTLGCYDTRGEAHEAYCAASTRLHGRFGRVA